MPEPSLAPTDPGAPQADAPAPSLVEAVRQVEALIQAGRAGEGRDAAAAALERARALGDAPLEAECLYAQGRACAALNELRAAQASQEQALAIFAALGDRRGEAHCLRELGWLAIRLAGPAQGREVLLQALARYRALDDREGEGMTLNELTLTTSDYAQQRAYYEHALAIFEALDDRHRLSILANNLGLLYLMLGLYSQARAYCERAVGLARALDARNTLVFSLDTLAHALLGLGDLAGARARYAELRALAEQTGKTLEVAYACLGLGRVALAEGRADEARLRLEEAAARLGALDAPAEHAAALAWLGAAAQARGDLATAEALSAEAAAILEAGLFSQDFPPQDVWWMRHRALAASAPGSEAAQAALRRAYATMQGGIASLSDAGLRRNYLNKVQINRQIVEGWSRQVGAATPEPAANDDPRDQLARMLQISAQMNERREDAALRQFILDQLVELSGAERALLALAEDEERVELLARGVPPEQMDAFAAEAQQALDQVRGTRRALLRHQVPAAAGSEDEPAPLRLRSQLCLPLVAGGRLIGALYADNREAFGRFAQADLDLLTVLATQAATALRNVGLYNEILRANVELEQRVAERTASLERRVAELAIVNRIGQAVASQLELDALIELVGTTMLETFRAQNVYVALYDAASEQISFPYDVENGQRISSSSLRFGAGLTSEILLTRRPLLLNGEAEMRAAGLRIASIGARARSFLGVPILVGEKPIGVISVQNTERDGAFSEADVRLLSTIAASVGVALENARLYQETRRMQQEAEAASVAKSTFLANMSHELRTPLNAVLGFAQLMANDSGLGARQHEHLGIISRSGEHLLGLINDVLEMSKIEAGRVTLNPAPFELPRLLQGVQEMFALRAEAKGLWMRFELAPGLPRYVLGDEGKLRQLIINLLGNAVKFTHSGGVTLRAARGEGVLLAFEIEDTGEGIAPEQLPSLFQPFVQTASGLRSQEGTGLGLAIARQFAQLMGGDISVSSEPGVGSLFRFEAELPPIRGDNPGVAARVERRVIGLAPDERQDYRVLVVDDKWENRHLLCEWLAGVGIEVREAADGAEALAIWEQWDPQLIWMDLRMPVLDGYEAIRRIKATTRGQATAVIALTASTFEQERDVTLSTGCDDFVRKPVREATIFAKLSQHLGIRFVYDEAAPGAHDTLLPPRAHDLAALPAALRAALREAVDEMDVEAARELAGQAALHSPALAQALAALLDEFRFDVLDQLLNESEQA